MSRILTWLQVTSDQFHIWNYFWAVKPIITSQESKDEVFLFVANMHSYNQVQDWSIRQNTLNTLKLYLATWVDPDKVFIYNQADVPGHTQLMWVLTSLTHMWFMERMHAYKDKSWKMKANEISVGLFTYPILMAADILLYDATHVPTWKDQKQHVEYARDIAWKFNHMYGETFVLPEPVISEDLGIIPWIDWRKMSKSYNNYIWFLDTDDELVKKIKKIPTSAIWIEEPKNPDECNVYKIYTLLLTNEEDAKLRERYTAWWLWFWQIKEELIEKMISFISPIRKSVTEITDEQIISILANNSPKANEIANSKIKDVYEKVGFFL